MDTSKLLVTATTRLPLRTFERVAKFAEINGLVRRSGEPNISKALVELARAGLNAQPAQTPQPQAVAQ